MSLWVQVLWTVVFTTMVAIAVGGNCIVIWIVIGETISIVQRSHMLRPCPDYFAESLCCSGFTPHTFCRLLLICSPLVQFPKEQKDKAGYYGQRRRLWWSFVCISPNYVPCQKLNYLFVLIIQPNKSHLFVIQKMTSLFISVKRIIRIKIKISKNRGRRRRRQWNDRYMSYSMSKNHLAIPRWTFYRWYIGISLQKDTRLLSIGKKLHQSTLYFQTLMKSCCFLFL